jgi:hypothetical protein
MKELSLSVLTRIMQYRLQGEWLRLSYLTSALRFSDVSATSAFCVSLSFPVTDDNGQLVGKESRCHNVIIQPPASQYPRNKRTSHVRYVTSYTAPKDVSNTFRASVHTLRSIHRTLATDSIATHTLCCPLAIIAAAVTTSSSSPTLPAPPVSRRPPPALAVQMKSGAPVAAAANSSKRPHCNDEHWVALLAAPLWQTLSGNSSSSSSSTVQSSS